MVLYGYGTQARMHQKERRASDTPVVSMNSHFHLIVAHFLAAVPTGQFLSGIWETLSRKVDERLICPRK